MRRPGCRSVAQPSPSRTRPPGSMRSRAKRSAADTPLPHSRRERWRAANARKRARSSHEIAISAGRHMARESTARLPHVRLRYGMGRGAMSGPDLDGEKDALTELLGQALRASLEPREVRRRGDAGLAEIAASAAPFVAARLAPGALRVRAHEPGGQRRGRTVVEALVPDQPFLFDTFRLALDRLGERAILVAH